MRSAHAPFPIRCLLGVLAVMVILVGGAITLLRHPAPTTSTLPPRGVVATSARKATADGGDRSEHDRAIARILRVGGSVERDEDEPDRPVVAIFLEGPQVS